MGAIDLLFAVKPDSERLHQLALSALLRHGQLLPLLGIARAPRAHHWDAQDGTFDLSVELDDGSQLFIEVKVDGPLSEGQIQRQMQELRAEGRTRDRLLYLLLGYSAITVDRALLESKAREAGVAQRYAVRGVAELCRALESPQILDATDPPSRDARDLAVAYRTHLQALQARTSGFAQRSVDQWGRGDFFGFFARCRDRYPSMQGAGIDALSGPGGGAPGCWWHFEVIEPGVRVYLQFEGPRLLIKLHAEPRDRRGALRDQACALLLALTPPPPLRIVRPAKLGQGEWMTIGHVEGVPVGSDERGLGEALAAAEQVLRELAQRLREAQKGRP